jgi:predicted permease
MTDFRRAWRRLRSTPALSALIVVILGVAIAVHLTGLATVAVITRPNVDVPEASRLVALSLRDPQSGRPGAFTEQSAAPLWTEPPLFDGLGLYASRVYRLETEGRALDVAAEAVAPAYFQAVGVQPAVGRPFDEPDNVAAAGAGVAVISHRLAGLLFGGPSQALGRTMTIDGTRVRVIGVTGERFGGLQTDSGADLWLPIRLARFMAGDGNRPRAPMLVGRLTDRVSLSTARAEVAGRWAAASSAGNDTYEIQVQPLTYGLSVTRSQWSDALAVLSTLSALLLVLSIASVIGVMLTRALARHRETAVELAMGAPRVHLLRSAAIEGALLVAGAYVLAVPLALWAGSHLTAELSFARPIPIRQLLPDARVWSWSGVLALLIIAAISLPQAVHSLRVAPAEGLRGTGRASRSLGWTGRSVVAAQVLLSLLLMVGAGLLLTTRSNLYANVRGFDDARVMFARLSRVPGDTGRLSPEYFTQLLNELGGLPRVERAALASTFPAYAGFVGAMQLETFRTTAAGAQVEARALVEYITPGFLSTLDLHVVSGRDVEWHDSEASTPVALVTQSLARTLFPTGEAIGQYLDYVQGNQTSPLQVVGVVPDLPMGTLRAPEVGTVFRPMTQAGGLVQLPMAFVRVSGDAGATSEPFARAVAAQGRHFVRGVFTLDSWFANALLRERLLATAAAILAALATALAALGVYITVAHAAAVRQEEIGIRLSLGASRRRLLVLMLKDTALSVVVGMAVGIPLALGLSRAFAFQFYGIDPSSPAVLSIAAAVVLVSALCAAGVPALRASTHSPAELLRQE